MELVGAEHPGKSDPKSRVVKAAVAAAREVYEEAPVIYPLTPGTGPVWPVAIAHGTPMISFGASYPGQNLHAPNENIRLDDYFRAMRMMGRFVREFCAK
jgi:acetylornithine deacetylase/succinyl-diaminopimelate desuccinylase-like protein